jgi:uncharacterized repeat protein (TIGR02543 family)
MKKILALMFNLVVGATLAAVTGGGLMAAVIAGGVLSLIPKTITGSLPMAIQVEIWEKDIVEGLFADNAFLNFAYNADQYVLQGKVVHIPQAGASAGTSVNRSELPATVTKRTDVDITYAIDEITSDPVLIPDADTVELSYSKRTSVTEQMRKNMYEASALNMLYRWAPSAGDRMIRTTGTAVAAHLPSATGSRNALTLDDVKKAQKQFNKDNVPSAERYLMVDAEMYDQLTNDMTANQSRDFLAAYDEKNGILGRIYGFNVIMRSQVIRYTNAATPAKKEWSAAGASTDNAAAICWQKQSVERALGDVKFFEKLGDPQYYGDIYSALIRLGGRIRRNDNNGVLAIVQAVVVATTYTVTFSVDGGSEVTAQTVESGNKATQPTAPTKTGFTFDGWYGEAGLTTLYDFNTPVTSNVTLYAKWTAEG